MTTYIKAFVQIPVKCHDGAMFVEALMAVPAELPISQISWLSHAMLDGICPIAGVGWDMTREKYVVILGAGARDETYDKEEWLRVHKGWQKVQDIDK